MDGENDRQDFLQYWRQFGNDANINGMMLNANASLYEESDRKDVCLLLPDLGGKTVLDAGAGIGRFTAELAARAERVSASDFISEYVEKLHNLSTEAFKDGKIIDVTVADATRLSYPENSYFLVFTNWLYMYFNSTECSRFTINALKWLEEGGYFKLRESCSEPSTGRVQNRKETSLHASVNSNPTEYRFSSVYLKLIETARYLDSNGQKWKFEIQICGSVPTYISHGNNWRQVQLIAKKVKADANDIVPTVEELKRFVNNDWTVAQKEKDNIVDGVKKYFGNKIFTNELIEENLTDDEKITASFIFQSSFNPWYKRIYPFSFKSNNHSLVWTNEGDRELFRCSLTAANEEKNPGIFFTYSNDNVFNAFDYVSKRNILLNNFMAIDYLSNHQFNFIETFGKVAKPNAKILLLESFSDEEEKNLKLSKLTKQYTIKCVTDDVHNEIKNIHQNKNIVDDITSKKWMFISLTTTTD
uniref:phosphoethanolamine N-methyltransferase n=1 Tax=Strongyloides venezuelensis TaxID=75913 RepID=A0A0K0FPF5_STRVS